MDWNQTVIPVGKGDEGFECRPMDANYGLPMRRTVRCRSSISTRKVSDTPDAKIGANRLKFTPDGKLVLISTARNGDLVIYDAASRKEFKRVRIGHGAAGFDGSCRESCLHRLWA